jgi:hypothetical protein
MDNEQQILSKEQITKQKHKEAMKKWYNTKGSAQMKNKYLDTDEKLTNLINKIKDNDSLIKKLIDTIGLVRIVTISQQQIIV